MPQRAALMGCLVSVTCLCLSNSGNLSLPNHFARHQCCRLMTRLWVGHRLLVGLVDQTLGRSTSFVERLWVVDSALSETRLIRWVYNIFLLNFS
jgi:hypothetical protein